MRELNFVDGFTSASEPTQNLVIATSFKQYASDAAYVTGKGSAAANGDAYYNTTDHLVRIYRDGAWESITFQPKVTSSRGVPTAIVLASGIEFAGKQPKNIWFVKGPASGGTIAANPQIAAGAFVGQELELVGCSDADYLALNHGNGLVQNGEVILEADDSITYSWDGTNWREKCRS